jgi:signal peptidase I
MLSEPMVPAPYVRREQEFMLSGPLLADLLRAVLERDAPFRFIAPGLSMSPFIRHGDTVMVEPLRGRDLHMGDVVAYLRPDGEVERLVIHRVVGQEDGAVVLRGDNCSEADDPISRANIVGLVTGVERRGRGVRSGLGRSGRWIAWLSARGQLLPLKTKLVAPLRRGGKLLRRLQCIPAFRAQIKRFRPTYTVREAKATDMMVVHAWANAGRESPPYRHDPNVTNYVARRGDEVLGFVQLVRRPDAQALYSGYWLHSLMVRTLYRGLGLGETLSRHVIEQAQAEGAPELLLTVFEDNAPAIALYHKLGFEHVRIPALEAGFDFGARRGHRRTMSMRKVLV